MVAPGSPDKLAKFLDLNPAVLKDSIFVDDSESYDAFKAMRFGNVDTNPPPKDVSLKPLNFGVGDWLAYLPNVVSLTAVKQGEEGIPEVVKMLGGTLVVDGAKVIYAVADPLPGQYPEPLDVLREVDLVM